MPPSDPGEHQIITSNMMHDAISATATTEMGSPADKLCSKLQIRMHN